MWASGAKLRGSLPSAIRSVEWAECESGGGGWLATGGEEATVGISWIPNRSELTAAEGGEGLAHTAEDSLFRSHFNLRGHLGEIRLVRWAAGGTKLASYDSWGRIIGWGVRASVLAKEFQIHTSASVTDMQWSHCGYYLLICGQNGSVQLFSAQNGTNFFSLQIQAVSPLSSKAHFTTCSWNQPNTRVALGTDSGEVVLLNPRDNGQTISTMTLREGIPVQSVQWYGPVTDCKPRSRPAYKTQGLSALMQNGDVMLFSDVSSRHCMCCQSTVFNGQAEWDSSDTLLVVVGYQPDLCTPVVRFLNTKGFVLFSVTEGLPQLPRPLKASTLSISWCLGDSAVLVAQGRKVYSIEVLHEFPSLQFLSRRAVAEAISDGRVGEIEEQLPLPRKEVEVLEGIVSPWIEAPLPAHGPHAIVTLFEPLPANQRLLCIMEPTDPSSLAAFTVKYEFLNHYIPILVARRKPRKPGKLLQGGYTIEPAPGRFSHQWALGKMRYWAREVSELKNEPCGTTRPESRHSQQRRGFVRRVKAAFSHGNRQEIVDAPSRRGQRSPPTHPPITTPVRKSRPLVLAETERNPVSNSYQFTTTSPLFEDGHLGSLSITTAYMKTRPRSLRISLSLKQGSEAEGGAVILHSRLPEWNEQYQMYELDFGGRVNQDSIKNFQVERDGHMVLQFGRVHGNTFCLDFEAPFSPVHALCTALCCL